MSQSHSDMSVEQPDGRVQLEERQEEHRRWRHAVGQQPEEQVFVPQEPVARKRISRRQRHSKGDHRVQADVVQRVQVRTAEHTSELQPLMSSSSAVICVLKTTKGNKKQVYNNK